MIFVIVIGTKSGTRRLARTKPELLDFSLHTLPTLFFFPLFSIIFFFPTGIHFICGFVLHPPPTPLLSLPRESLPSCLQQPTSPTPRAFNNSLTTSCHGCKPARVCSSTPSSDLQIFGQLELDVVSVSVPKIYSPNHTKASSESPQK